MVTDAELADFLTMSLWTAGDEAVLRALAALPEATVERVVREEADEAWLHQQLHEEIKHYDGEGASCGDCGRVL